MGTWRSGPLSAKPREQQAALFIQKMNKLQNKKEGFVCEREVPEDEFEPFGVYNRFRALGWEAALKCYDGDDKKLYMDEIEEWVSTLSLHRGSRPNRMRLHGMVNGVRITMSFDTLNQIADFDSLPSNLYQYPDVDRLYYRADKSPNWLEMLGDLFIDDRNPEKWLRDDLKPEPKLLHLIMQSNVVPRRGDRTEVRLVEIPLLYALMNGGPVISYRYLVMYNIWLCRENHDRKIVPHCRLITALLKHNGVITDASRGFAKRFPPFGLRTLGSNWVFTEERDRYILRTPGRNERWVVRKDEDEEEEEEEGDEEEEEDDEGGEAEAMDEDILPEVDIEGHRRTKQTYDRIPFGADWAFEGNMEDIIRNQRPNVYDSWTGDSQIHFDHATRIGASHERQAKELHDRLYGRQEEWMRSLAIAQQREINQRYEDDRQRRMHDQWHSGQPLVPDPPVIDYTSLPPFDGSVRYPVPPLHHSEWLDPYRGSTSAASSSQPPPQEQPEQQEGAYDFSSFENTFNQIFGPPGPRYY